MFEIKTEDFTNEEKQTITTLTREVAVLAGKVNDSNKYLQLRKDWFGNGNASSKALMDNLKRMDEYLNKKCIRITYVKKNVGHQVDSVAVDPGDYGQVIPNVGYTTANFKTTEWHVSSGLRVFTMNEYFDAVATGDREEMVNYVYHEISHKVLNTVDYRYGSGTCKAFAISHPNHVLKNADNYGYFIAAVDAAG